jgi:hypothetical protein
MQPEDLYAEAEVVLGDAIKRGLDTDALWRIAVNYVEEAKSRFGEKDAQEFRDSLKVICDRRMIPAPDSDMLIPAA